jgi:PPOX class probable F420-dependent enzyme
LTAGEARRLFAAARVARLATADAAGRPHLVPIVFAVAGDDVLSAVDAKPKRTTALRRLENVRQNPRVALLADHYDDSDWDALWWARADGTARVLDAGEPDAARALELLAERYAQYRTEPPRGPVLAVAVERWSGWRAG